MKNDHPWREIEAPSKPSSFNARRIPDIGSEDWGLYWAVDSDRCCLLILRHASGRRASHHLPMLKGLVLEDRNTEDRDGNLVIVRLADPEHRDIFYRFCEDIVAAVRLARAGEDAVERLAVRTWRWHRLLTTGRDGRLSRSEQKGLIGELLVLERHLLPVVSAGDAVRGWVGPLGAPRDFQIGDIGVEAKTCTPLASKINISSAEQLDSSNSTRVFLHVIEVSEALEDSPSAVTVPEVVKRTREMVVEKDMSAEGEFEDRLLAAGFDWADDYSEDRWLVGSESLYEVVEGFPRITPETTPAGVAEVRYLIALAQCDDFRVPDADLAGAIAGGQHGD